MLFWITIHNYLRTYLIYISPVAIVSVHTFTKNGTAFANVNNCYVNWKQEEAMWRQVCFYCFTMQEELFYLPFCFSSMTTKLKLDSGGDIQSPNHNQDSERHTELWSQVIYYTYALNTHACIILCNCITGMTVQPYITVQFGILGTPTLDRKSVV